MAEHDHSGHSHASSQTSFGPAKPKDPARLQNSWMMAMRGWVDRAKEDVKTIRQLQAENERLTEMVLIATAEVMTAEQVMTLTELVEKRRSAGGN